MFNFVFCINRYMYMPYVVTTIPFLFQELCSNIGNTIGATYGTHYGYISGAPDITPPFPPVFGGVYISYSV